MLRQIGSVNLNPQLRMARAQLVAHFLQALLAPRYEHKRAGPTCELARKLATNPGRCAGDERLAAIKADHNPFLLSSGARTRQTFSATILSPAAVGWI